MGKKVFHIPSVIVLVVGLLCVVVVLFSQTLDHSHLSQERKQLDHEYAPGLTGSDDGVPVANPGVAVTSKNLTSNSSGDSDTIPVPKVTEQGVASVAQDPEEDSGTTKQLGPQQSQQSETHELQPDDMKYSVESGSKPVPEANGQEVVSVEGGPGEESGIDRQEGPQLTGFLDHDSHESEESSTGDTNPSGDSGTNPLEKRNDQGVVSADEDRGEQQGQEQPLQSELHESQQDDLGTGALEKYLPSFAKFSLQEPFGFEQGSLQREEYFARAVKCERVGSFRATLTNALPDNTTRNHCWRPSDGEDLLCIPKVILGGFPKCGTTDAFFMLTQHPKIPRTIKESHSFRAANSPSQYASYFQSIAVKVDNDTSEYNDMLVIDGSASTIWDWTSDEPTPYILSQYAPDALAVVMVREPVSRLWSEYRYFRPSISAKQFHSNVVKSLQALETCMSVENVTNPCLCLTEFPRKYSIASSRLGVGAYSCHLRAWRAVAPNTRVKIVDVAELFDEKLAETMTSVLEYLGLPFDGPIESTAWWPAMKAVPGSEKANTGTQAVHLSMLPETESLLTEFYRPFVNDFEAQFNVSFG